MCQIYKHKYDVRQEPASWGWTWACEDSTGRQHFSQGKAWVCQLGLLHKLREKNKKQKQGTCLNHSEYHCSQMHMHRGSSCQRFLHWIQHSSEDNQGNQQVMPQTDVKVSSPTPVLGTHNSPSIRATFSLKRALGVIHLSCTEGKEQKVSDEKHQIHRVHDAIHRKSYELTKY